MDSLYDECHRLFEYNDGNLVRKVTVNNNAKKGDIAGSFNKDIGYFTVRINKKSYYVHRIVYLMFYGFIPNQIDHKNTDKTVNKIGNLRPATESENKCNIGLKSNNSSGYKNVIRSCGKFKVEIQINGIRHYFGHFDDPYVAGLVARRERSILHGEFCRHE